MLVGRTTFRNANIGKEVAPPGIYPVARKTLRDLDIFCLGTGFMEYGWLKYNLLAAMVGIKDALKTDCLRKMMTILKNC